LIISVLRGACPALHHECKAGFLLMMLVFE